jgi:DNA-binding winged helix-turn-helix (wHTH) protein
VRLQIGSVLFDGEARELVRAGVPVRVTRKAFDLLELLLSSRPRAVSKEEIHEALWPRTFVAESSLQGLVSEIRRALGDDARSPRLVRTVWGIGYAFAGEARQEGEERAGGDAQAASRPCLVRGRVRVALAEGETLLGRDSEPAAAFADASISRRHARVLVEAGRVLLEDLGSKNGTLVGGQKATRPVALSDGVEVRLGLAAFTFRAARPSEPTKTVPG